MSKMIQIRNVPDALHRRLKARAAELGLTLSDYLLQEVAQLAQRPTIAELAQRARQRDGRRPAVDAVRAVRYEREARR